LHKSRATLYAYRSEIDAWLTLRHPHPKQNRKKPKGRETSWALPEAAEISLAVLPLRNLSVDSEDEYFADGMTEAVLTALGKISAFRVISHQSVMHYKGTDKPLLAIANELKVPVAAARLSRRGHQ
jgi:TolB-like protein